MHIILRIAHKIDVDNRDAGRVRPARLSAPDLEPGPARLRARGRAAATIARRELAARPSLIRPPRFFARYTRPPPATWKRDRNAQGAASGIPGPPRPEDGRPPQPGRDFGISQPGPAGRGPAASLFEMYFGLRITPTEYTMQYADQQR